MTKLPEYDEEITCQNPECQYVEAQVMTGMYGIFGGGGMGAYTMCEHCGAVLSKSCDTHKDQENEPTEIKAADVQDTDSDEP